MTEDETAAALARAKQTTADATAFRLGTIGARVGHLLRERPRYGDRAAVWIDRELKQLTAEEQKLTQSGPAGERS